MKLTKMDKATVIVSALRNFKPLTDADVRMVAREARKSMSLLDERLEIAQRWGQCLLDERNARNA